MSDVKHALKEPNELFCEKMQKLVLVGKSKIRADEVKEVDNIDQKILRRDHKLWREFKDNIRHELSEVASKGVEIYDIPLKYFPVREKIYEWAKSQGFDVVITTAKEFPTVEETFTYLSDLFEDSIMDKKVYYLMTFDWSSDD
jgi:phosphoglycolate phosphatase-like HAD superfamily hydrolase